MRYSIITPLKNEEKYIASTIQSVLAQKMLPEKWIIIDDNSTDKTRKLVNDYLSDNNIIKLIVAPKLEIKEISARIAYLFNYGYKSLSKKTDLIMKLDGDTTLPSNYCHDIVSMFIKNPKLGIASGCAEYKGIREDNSDNTLTRGAAKFYNSICFEQIGFAYESRGWDTIDNYAAQALGWDTKKFDIYFNHNKEEGKKSGLIMLRYWTGLYNGRVPYYFPYFIFKIIYYFFSPPIIVGSFLELIGYLNSRFIIKNRPFPSKVSKYVIKTQREKIINSLKKGS